MRTHDTGWITYPYLCVVFIDFIDSRWKTNFAISRPFFYVEYLVFANVGYSIFAQLELI